MAPSRPSASLDAQAFVMVAASRGLLRLRPTTSVLRYLAGRGGGRRNGAELDPELVVAAIQRAGHWVRADCLPQSVALAAVLCRGGASPTLVLGCRRDGPGDWGAHAWVELDGKRLEPVPAPEHAELARLSQAQGWKITPVG